MADTYNLISNIAYIMAVLFFVLSVVLFFKFNIIKITGDLSGRNARKAIQQMKDKAAAVRVGVLDMGVAVRKVPQDTEDLDTELLDKRDDDATEILVKDADATVYLDRDVSDRTEIMASRFQVDREILFIHTMEEMHLRREYESI